MLQSLLGGYPLVGVVGEELCKEVVTTGRELFREELPEVLRRFPLGED